MTHYVQIWNGFHPTFPKLKVLQKQAHLATYWNSMCLLKLNDDAAKELLMVQSIPVFLKWSIFLNITSSVELKPEFASSSSSQLGKCSLRGIACKLPKNLLTFDIWPGSHVRILVGGILFSSRGYNHIKCMPYAPFRSVEQEKFPWTRGSIRP